MAAMIDCVMKPFRRLNISTTEFAALQAVMFFDPGLLLKISIYDNQKLIIKIRKDWMRPVNEMSARNKRK